MDTLWLFQSISRRRPKNMLDFDISFCYYTVENSCTGLSVVSSTLMSSSMVVVEFRWNITSVFFMLIFRPNFYDAVANISTLLWISSDECAFSALSSAQSSSLTSIFVVLSSL